MDRQRRATLRAAKETLELVIAENRSQLATHQQQLEELQETIFVVFDDLRKPSLVGLEAKQAYFDFGRDAARQRQFLLLGQQRHHAQVEKYRQRIEELQGELMEVNLALIAVQ